MRLACFFALLYFIAGLATLSDYGVNWDAMSHLSRGQAYLHYYLTGNKDYTDLKNWNLYRTKEESIKNSVVTENMRNRLYFQKVDTIFFSPDIPKGEVPRTSIYQNSDIDLIDTLKRYDFGHPHISDVLSSAFNLILFQKMGLLNDVDSYRVYSVLLSSLLVGLVYWWTASSYGKFTGFIAALSLSMYPLFWAESHFNNEKDIPQAVFWSFMLISFWKAVVERNWKWVLVSGIFFGLALGTKFNILFSIFVILPWLAVYLYKSRKIPIRKFFKKNSKFILASLFAPILGISIFVNTWPFFWTDPIGKITKIVLFYKEIGSTNNIDPNFLGPFGINTYPFLWILYTTPLVIILLVLMGIISTFQVLSKEKQKQSLLILLWFLVPIIRVSWPGANIYGGVRQIMEFIPAMAILSGIGAAWLTQRLGVLGRLGILGVIAVLLVIPIIRLHPNENVYFNELIGGLSGAKKSEIPSWGNSYGNVYLQGIEWLNENANPDAKLTLATNYLSDIPRFKLRPDIDLDNHHWSGFERGGEYAMEMYYDYPLRSRIRYAYYDTFLNPVYEVKVDGVPLLKIWKNDLKYTKRGFEKQMEIKPSSIEIDGEKIKINFKTQVFLTKLTIEHSTISCDNNINGAFIEVTKGDQNWIREPGLLIDPESPESSPGLDENIFVYLFPAREAISIILNSNNLKSCLLKDTKVNVWGLEKTL